MKSSDRITSDFVELYCHQLFFDIGKAGKQLLLLSPFRDGATISPQWSFAFTLHTIILSVYFLVFRVSFSDLATRYQCVLSISVKGTKPNQAFALRFCKKPSRWSISCYGLFVMLMGFPSSGDGCIHR